MKKNTTGQTIQKVFFISCKKLGIQLIQVWIFTFYGNIPNGSGLSSSSSLELLIGVIAEKLFDLKLERLDLVKIGKQTENDFIGVNSGIMDQFAIGMGADQRAIYLDTNTLEYDLVPLDLKDNVVVIMNTNKRRELADSKYNERRAECEKSSRRTPSGLKYSNLG